MKRCYLSRVVAAQPAIIGRPTKSGETIVTRERIETAGQRGNGERTGGINPYFVRVSIARYRESRKKHTPKIARAKGEKWSV